VTGCVVRGVILGLGLTLAAAVVSVAFAEVFDPVPGGFPASEAQEVMDDEDRWQTVTSVVWWVLHGGALAAGVAAAFVLARRRAAPVWAAAALTTAALWFLAALPIGVSAYFMSCSTNASPIDGDRICH
jgi:hypothetical protein